MLAVLLTLWYPALSVLGSIASILPGGGHFRSPPEQSLRSSPLRGVGFPLPQRSAPLCAPAALGCVSAQLKQAPSGLDRIHGVKQDGYRMIVIREDSRVRLLPRN